MYANVIYFLLHYIVFGLGAGIRYIFFRVIGKKKKYNDLIEHKSQDKWNLLISIIMVALIIYVISESGLLSINEKPLDKRIMKYYHNYRR